jgi:hypothetical protein
VDWDLTMKVGQMETVHCGIDGTQIASGRPDPLAGHTCVEVVFYKEILDHRGFPHRCELLRISTRVGSHDDTISGAIDEFEHAYGVSNWRVAADGYEIIREVHREA